MVSSSNLNGTCWPAKPWNRDMEGRIENLEIPLPQELVDCRRTGESIPIQTPETGPVHVPEDRCPYTYRMLRDCLWPKPKVA